jgi:hypothetical protein
VSESEVGSNENKDGEICGNAFDDADSRYLQSVVLLTEIATFMVEDGGALR